MIPDPDRIVYLNGNFTKGQDARISVFDRGFLFGDGVYEVVAVIHGRLIDFDPHMARLDQSLRSIGLTCPVDRDELRNIHHSLIEKNALIEGLIYMQITRGIAPRDFGFPETVTPTLFLFSKEISIIDNPKAKKGISLKSVEDIRWKRRDIKSISLLAQVLARQEAISGGGDEAIMIENGHVTEGSQSSIGIIRDKIIIVPPNGHDILRGITRTAIETIKETLGLKAERRFFTLDEAINADEVFISSATSFITPVVRIDDHTIGNGTHGPIVPQLRNLYLSEICGVTIK